MFAKLELPELRATGNYKVKGSVLGLNLNGQGTASFVASKSKIYVKMLIFLGFLTFRLWLKIVFKQIYNVHKYFSENIILSFNIKTRLRRTDDLVFSEILSLKAKILNIGDFHIDVQNLFGGQRDLEYTANDLFNQNWRELYGTLAPTLEQTLELVLKDRFTKIYSFVPANFFINNLPWMLTSKLDWVDSFWAFGRTVIVIITWFINCKSIFYLCT